MLTQIYSFHFLVFLILAYEKQVAQILVKAREVGMFDGQYVFITSNFKINKNWNISLEKFSGFIDYRMPQKNESEIESFNAEVVKRLKKPPIPPGLATKKNKKKVSEEINLVLSS